MVDRINLILKAKNLTSRQFAEEIGIQPSGMSHILSGRNRPSLDFVMKVVTRYPEIDIKWLTLGEGEMYVAPSSMPVSMASSRQPSPVPTSPTQHQSVAEPLSTSSRRPEKEVHSNYVSPKQEPERIAVMENENVMRPLQSTPDRNLFSASEPSLFDEVEPTNAVPPKETVSSLGQQQKPTEGLENKENEKRDSGAGIKEEPLVSKPDEGVLAGIFSNPSPEVKVDENRVDEASRPPAVEKRNLAKKRVSKVIIFYDDHSFSEYYPE